MILLRNNPLTIKQKKYYQQNGPNGANLSILFSFLPLKLKGEHRALYCSVANERYLIK